MPLTRIVGVFLLTADTNDICSAHVALQQAGPGFYRCTPLSAAAADSTITINDGKSDIVSAEPIPVKAAAVTFPEFDKSADFSWTWFSGRSDRPLINVVDGTNAEMAIIVEKLPAR